MKKSYLLGTVCTCLFVLITTTANAAFIVTSGTGDVGDGVSFVKTQDDALFGLGLIVGGKTHFSGGAPAGWFRAGTMPSFEGALTTTDNWYSGGLIEGALEGDDNWAKFFRDSDGAVSWAQFHFDTTNPSTGTLFDIPLYVTQTDGSDFTLAQAVAAASAVPVPAAVWLFGSGLIGLIGVAKRKKA